MHQFLDHRLGDGVGGAGSAQFRAHVGIIRRHPGAVVSVLQQAPDLRHAQAAVINSGTASLEAALIGTPQVVGYKTAWLTYLIGRAILKIKFISLAHLVIDRPAFKELLQNYLTGENLVAEVRRLLEDGNYRARMAADYADVRAKLGSAGASDAVAGAMIEELMR